jgi:hypothetical protein
MIFESTAIMGDELENFGNLNETKAPSITINIIETKNDRISLPT